MSGECCTRCGRDANADGLTMCASCAEELLAVVAAYHAGRAEAEGSGGIGEHYVRPWRVALRALVDALPRCEDLLEDGSLCRRIATHYVVNRHGEDDTMCAQCAAYTAMRGSGPVPFSPGIEAALRAALALQGDDRGPHASAEDLT